MEVVLATHNLHKMRELREMLKEIISCDVYSLLDFPQYHLPPETGTTFEENATTKALHAAKHLQRWVIADDSGLVVPALQGKPGIYSKRYAGENSSDAENNKMLLQKMDGMEEIERSAYYECCLVVANEDGVQKVVRGTVEGSISYKEKGGCGFGYDPLFVKNEYEKTFAELDEQTKNRISHRRKACDKLIPFLESLNSTL